MSACTFGNSIMGCEVLLAQLTCSSMPSPTGQSAQSMTKGSLPPPMVLPHHSEASNMSLHLSCTPASKAHHLQAVFEVSLPATLFHLEHFVFAFSWSHHSQGCHVNSACWPVPYCFLWCIHRPALPPLCKVLVGIGLPALF